MIDLNRAEAEKGRWVVICPATRYIEPEVEEFLTAMRLSNIYVGRAIGSSDIARVRSEIASRVLQQSEFERVLWVDSDQTLDVETALRLLLSEHDFVTAIGPERMKDRLLIDLLEPREELVLGTGEPFEISHCGFGAVVTSRRCLEAARGSMRPTSDGWWPLFLPYVREDGVYMAEDWAFCERARAGGVRLYADPQAPTEHLQRRYRSWADVEQWQGLPRLRVAR